MCSGASPTRCMSWATASVRCALLSPRMCLRALKASHVLSAIGVDAALAQGSLVFTLGKGNTTEDVDYVIEILPGIIDRLRQMSPLYQPDKA